MDIFDILTLLCGLSLFLYGMHVMGDALKKSAGNRLKNILSNLTSNQWKGFLLGLGVTAIIQSSSATTVMVVGFVNSAAMSLRGAVGVIMGANVGTAVTSWLTALSGIGNGGETVGDVLSWLRPDAWMPLLAVIGICMLMFSKSARKRDFSAVLLGFTVLMVGMNIMSGSVGGLKESESFRSVLTMFENPVLGVLAGTVLTAIVQSSSASVGILQSLTVTGAISYGAAIPIVMGQNIGTCVTALISSIGATKNGKRAALVHLYFNVIGVLIWLSLFYFVDWIADFSFVSSPIDMWGVALVHTVFKILCVLLFWPFTRYLEKLAVLSVRGTDETESNLLDDRLLSAPSVAVERCKEVAASMMDFSADALCDSLGLLDQYDEKTAQRIRAAEARADRYEDALGSYLVKLSGVGLSVNDSHEVTKLLHIIGDMERISDHAVNIVESAEEMRDKHMTFSSEAQHELTVLRAAVGEIIRLAQQAFVSGNLTAATSVEPLEQTVDLLRDRIKLNHTLRLQKSECTIEHGFVLSDILTDLERVADHCSNIAGCVLEMKAHGALDMHGYLDAVKSDSDEFQRKFHDYRIKYSLEKNSGGGPQEESDI